MRDWGKKKNTGTEEFSDVFFTFFLLLFFWVEGGGLVWFICLRGGFLYLWYYGMVWYIDRWVRREGVRRVGDEMRFFLCFILSVPFFLAYFFGFCVGIWGLGTGL